MDDFDDGYKVEDLNFLLVSLQTCFKDLSEEKVNQWAISMAQEGIKEEYVLYVSAEDLQRHGLGKYQAKALLSYWKPAKSVAEHQVVQQNRSASVDPSQTAPHSSSSLLHILDFKIKWEQVHQVKVKSGPSAKEVLENDRIPDPRLRCKIVENIVTQVAMTVNEPSRASFNYVYDQIMAKYPKSFAETLGRGTEVTGGLLLQLKTKFDNDFKRPERNRHLKDGDAMLKKYEKPAGKFSYGCVRWRARDLVPGQTEISMLEQKEKMKTIFQETRSKYWDWKEITPMLKNTYKPQREMLNKNTEDALAEQKSKRRKRTHEEMEEEVDEPQAKVTINEIYNEWPFLFSYLGMHVHFEELTKVNLEKELDSFLKTKQETIIKFFENLEDENCEFYSQVLRNMKKAQKKTDKVEGSHELRAICLMLPKYFEEAGFIEVVNETKTLEILNSDNRAPAYPGLAVPAKQESLFKGKKFFLGVDSEFQYSLICFKRAISCVFMLYFVLNLDYAPDSQVTLEFLQRHVFNIDPPRGNKRPAKSNSKQRGKFSSKVVHPMVARLCRKLNFLERKEAQINDNDSDSSSDQSDNLQGAQ